MTSSLRLGLFCCSLLPLGCSDGPSDPGTADAAVDVGRVDTSPPLPPQTLAVDSIAIFQGVKIPLAEDGLAVAPGPRAIVVGREALIRIYLKPGPGWRTKAVVGTFTITSSRRPPFALTTAKDVRATLSEDADLESTVNFDIPADVLQTDSAFSFSMKRESIEFVRWPAEGEPSQPIGALSTGEKGIRVTIVPVRYNADKSARLPSTTPEAIELYKNFLYSIYPTRKIDITIRPEPFDWADAIEPGGDGWGELLGAIQRLRADDKAPQDMYYYGAFVPRERFRDYCREGCTLGLSNLVLDARDAALRASIGVTYTDEYGAGTFAHELGHAHGLPHAPCGAVAGADRKFPYKEGAIGVWGYNVIEKRLYAPDFSDFMGYCSPDWISDYNWKNLFRRVSSINGLVVPKTFSDLAAPESPPPAAVVTGPVAKQRTRFVRVRGDGTLVWSESAEIQSDLYGEPHDVTLEDSSGRRVVRGFYYPYGDLPGGTLLFADPKIAPARIHVDGLFGARQSLVLPTRR